MSNPDPMGAANGGAENKAAALLKATIHSCKSLISLWKQREIKYKKIITVDQL